MHSKVYLLVPLMAASALAAPAPQYSEPLTPVSPVSTSTSCVTSSMYPSPSSTDLPSSITTPNTTDVPYGAEAASTAGNITLIQSLELAPTAVDRIDLLNNSFDWLYDFLNPPSDPNLKPITQGLGGRTVKADRKTFPALIGTGVSMTVGLLGPCGLNTPHTHPRSAELNIAVQGRLIAEFIAENGAPTIRNIIDTFQATVFPQGALHTEMNPDCEPATFVAGFASEDPGVQQAAQTLFDIDDDLLEAAFLSDFTFDGVDIDQFRALIPKNVALGVESCLQRCGLEKRR